MRTFVDYYQAHDLAFLNCVRREGVAGIARYLTNSMDDERQLTKQEVADAHEAGLEILFFYEMSPTYAGYFTYAQGAEDCRQAVERLYDLGAPEGSVVYFAVDAPPSRIPPSVLTDYFNGVESMRQPQIVPGIYGFEAHVEFARANFHEVGKHLAQTYGTPRGSLDLWQHEQDALCGVAVDYDDVYVEGWRKEDTMTQDEFNAMFDVRLRESGLDGHSVDKLKKDLYSHIHGNDPILKQTTPPLIPPVFGAAYAGSSADYSQVFWIYPDGTRHTFIDGVEKT